MRWVTQDREHYWTLGDSAKRLVQPLWRGRFMAKSTETYRDGSMVQETRRQGRERSSVLPGPGPPPFLSNYSTR